jgi:hypothetical protein
MTQKRQNKPLAFNNLNFSAMSGTFLVEEPPEDIQKSLGKNSTGMGRAQQQPECKYRQAIWGAA